MGEDGQRVPVGPSSLEDGGFDGVVPSDPVQVDIGRGGCERQPLAVLQLRRLGARLPRTEVPRAAMQRRRARGWTRERARVERVARVARQKARVPGRLLHFAATSGKAWECRSRSVNADQAESKEGEMQEKKGV